MITKPIALSVSIQISLMTTKKRRMAAKEVIGVMFHTKAIVNIVHVATLHCQHCLRCNYPFSASSKFYLLQRSHNRCLFKTPGKKLKLASTLTETSFLFETTLRINNGFDNSIAKQRRYPPIFSYIITFFLRNYSS